MCRPYGTRKPYRALQPRPEGRGYCCAVRSGQMALPISDLAPNPRPLY